MIVKENLIATKSYAFALNIIKLSRVLIAKNEYVLSKQVLSNNYS
ncbi:hypothetical protein CJ739_310 [Mariniflexile rhizosphaerae]|nr:hypothetical protein CJ739_310 [Mariniflexile sp. TRM1-10]PLB18176.1 MAG: hypothetical protein TRG1_3006 [Flavobacteriaceae bacterium FS1-H7996/R]